MGRFQSKIFNANNVQFWLHVKVVAGLSLCFSLIVGCAKVAFEQIPTCPELEARGENVTCDSVAPNGFVRVSDVIRAGRVDILFVNDNSGSMSVEQKKMGNRFPNFLNSIKNLDYQIAMITTDISASPRSFNPFTANGPKAANGFGTLQDGKFLPFNDDSGQFVTNILTNDTPDHLSLFQNTVERDETSACDSKKDCPSPDERGIYALNLALERVQGQSSEFFRKESHLTVVILSDEDERSKSGESVLDGVKLSLESRDLPETFVSNVTSRLGFSKTVSVHGVYIAPGNISCLNTQNAQAGVSGFEAKIYSQLVNPSSSLKRMGNILDGVNGNICASDYGVQLGDIGSKIGQIPIQLVCTPREGSIEIQVLPEPNFEISFEIREGNRVYLTPSAPVGTDIHISYDCPQF